MQQHKSENLKSIRTYEAWRILGFFESILLAGRELYHSRYVIWHFFVRDFLAGFRQRLLGYLWIVILPLVGIASFVFMQKCGILNPGHTEIPYPIFVYVGMSIWGIFVNSATVVGNSLVTNSDLMVRANIPKIALATMGLTTIYYNLMINLLVMTVVLLLFHTIPSPLAFLYPLLILPIVVLGAGIGLALAVIGVVIRDAVTLFTTIISFVMYVTPVIYTAKFSHPILKNIVLLNPLTQLVDTPRRMFFLGASSNITAFILSTLFSLMVFMIGIYVFYSLKDKVAERL